MENIPTEILRLILSCNDHSVDLRQCVLVNKAFYRAINSKLWESPRSNYVIKTPLIKCLQLPRENHPVDSTPLGHHVRRLLLNQLDSMENVLGMLALMPFLEDLILTNPCLENYDMNKMMQLCPQLRTLRTDELKITDESMTYVGQNCQHLRGLFIRFSMDITIKTLIALKNCPLETICIEHCSRLMKASTADALRSFGQLTCLYLVDHSFGLTVDFMRQLLQPNPDGSIPLARLTSFTISGQDPPIDDSVLVPFIESHPLLEIIDLDGCQLGNASLIAMSKHLPQLERFTLKQNTGISARLVRQIVMECSRLKRMDLVDFGWLPKACFPEISRSARDRCSLQKEEIDQIRMGPSWTISNNDDIPRNPYVYTGSTNMNINDDEDLDDDINMIILYDRDTIARSPHLNLWTSCD